MVAVGRIEAGWANGEQAIVRLLRHYAACRQTGELPLPSLIALGSNLGLGAPAAVALASVFQIIEECLGRALDVECCGSRGLTGDEHAVLMLMVAPIPRPSGGNAAIPHGLPGVLAWAVHSTRQLCASTDGPAASGQLGACPFQARSLQ